MTISLGNLQKSAKAQVATYSLSPKGYKIISSTSTIGYILSRIQYAIITNATEPYNTFQQGSKIGYKYYYY